MEFGTIIEEKKSRFKFPDFFPKGTLDKLKMFKQRAIRVTSIKELHETMRMLNNLETMPENIRFYLEFDEPRWTDEYELQRMIETQQELDTFDKIYLMIKNRSNANVDPNDKRNEKLRCWIIMQNELYVSKMADEHNFEKPEIPAKVVDGKIIKSV